MERQGIEGIYHTRVSWKCHASSSLIIGEKAFRSCTLCKKKEKNLLKCSADLKTTQKIDTQEKIVAVNTEIIRLASVGRNYLYFLATRNIIDISQQQFWNECMPWYMIIYSCSKHYYEDVSALWLRKVAVIWKKRHYV